MKFIDCPSTGAPDVMILREGSRPEPKAGEVLIEVYAAGVNRPDVAQRSGSYPPPPGASPILGLEVSGVIAACGPGVSLWKKGDRVCALTPGGGYAEYCVTPEGHCLPVPEGLSFEEAAGIPETFFTVWTNVFDRGKLQAGETFLIHGGTSGIGVTAIQLAKNFGAKVIATAGSEEKCRRCIELGADLAIDYKKQDFVAEVKRFTGDQGVHVILDMIGGPYFQKNLSCLAIEGRLVQIAFLQGDEISLRISQIMRKRLTLSGSTLRPRSVPEKTEIAKSVLKNIWPLFASGKIRVVIDQVLPLEQVVQAHQHMESSQHIGKIILKVKS